MKALFFYTIPLFFFVANGAAGFKEDDMCFYHLVKSGFMCFEPDYNDAVDWFVGSSCLAWLRLADLDSSAVKIVLYDTGFPYYAYLYRSYEDADVSEKVAILSAISESFWSTLVSNYTSYHDKHFQHVATCFINEHERILLKKEFLTPASLERLKALKKANYEAFDLFLDFSRGRKDKARGDVLDMIEAILGGMATSGFRDFKRDFYED